MLCHIEAGSVVLGLDCTNFQESQSQTSVRSECEYFCAQIGTFASAKI